jgi:tetratricopeptide (TPR) repeat protein
MNPAIYRKWFYVVFLLFYAAFTYTRNYVWENEITLWNDVAYMSPHKAVPHINLGNAFIRRNALQYAEHEFMLALDVNSRDVRALNGLAVIYLKRKQFDEAIRVFKILAMDKNDDPHYLSNLGVVYMQKGLMDDAIKEFEAAIAMDPNYADAHYNLGLAFRNKGMLKEAKQQFKLALRVYPGHHLAREKLEEINVLLLQDRN